LNEGIAFPFQESKSERGFVWCFGEGVWRRVTTQGRGRGAKKKENKYNETNQHNNKSVDV